LLLLQKHGILLVSAVLPPLFRTKDSENNGGRLEEGLSPWSIHLATPHLKQPGKMVTLGVKNSLMSYVTTNSLQSKPLMKYQIFHAYHHKQRTSFGLTVLSGLLVSLLTEINHSTFAKKLVSVHRMDQSLGVQDIYDSTLAAHLPYYKKASSDYETRLVHTKLLVSSTVN
jgi:hypothetical protein